MWYFTELPVWSRQYNIAPNHLTGGFVVDSCIIRRFVADNFLRSFYNCNVLHIWQVGIHWFNRARFSEVPRTFTSADSGGRRHVLPSIVKSRQQIRFDRAATHVFEGASKVKWIYIINNNEVMIYASLISVIPTWTPFALVMCLDDNAAMGLPSDGLPRQRIMVIFKVR